MRLLGTDQRAGLDLILVDQLAGLLLRSAVCVGNRQLARVAALLAHLAGTRRATAHYILPCPAPHGCGLTAIMGLTLTQVENLIEGSGTYIADLNAETQIVIAGSDDDMAQVAKRAGEKGASKAHRLAVSVPSHCVNCWITLRKSWWRRLVMSHAFSSALRLSQWQYRTRAVDAGKDCRRSRDEHGADGALAGGGDFRLERGHDWRMRCRPAAY